MKVRNRPSDHRTAASFLTDAFQGKQSRGWRGAGPLVGTSEQVIPLGFHRFDLLEKEFQPVEFAADLGLEMRPAAAGHRRS